ncbi:unnamed protein product [Polarella glacialis]|uniref:Uncharacterized protein n=1 Tax=Polarella glacialis TaxID=89957 RepID=A0A813IWK3_POLGL|nr:unnamed protein product [Polarella glacialis]
MLEDLLASIVVVLVNAMKMNSLEMHSATACCWCRPSLSMFSSLAGAFLRRVVSPLVADTGRRFLRRVASTLAVDTGTFTPHCVPCFAIWVLQLSFKFLEIPAKSKQCFFWRTGEVIIINLEQAPADARI